MAAQVQDCKCSANKLIHQQAYPEEQTGHIKQHLFKKLKNYFLNELIKSLYYLLTDVTMTNTPTQILFLIEF